MTKMGEIGAGDMPMTGMGQGSGFAAEGIFWGCVGRGRKVQTTTKASAVCPWPAAPTVP